VVAVGFVLLFVVAAFMVLLYSDCYNADCGGGDVVAGFLLLASVILLAHSVWWSPSSRSWPAARKGQGEEGTAPEVATKRRCSLQHGSADGRTRVIHEAGAVGRVSQAVP
jgi:hypothetical protein